MADRVLGFAVVAWSLSLEEWCVFAQAERRELMDGLRDRLEILGVEARVVDCELLDNGDVQLLQSLSDPVSSDRLSH